MLETNAGTSRSNKLAKVLRRKNPVRFNDWGITNIFSLYLLTQELWITMNIAKENSINVHYKNGHVNKFKPRGDFKITDKHGNMLQDEDHTAWIAGVEFEESTEV